LEETVLADHPHCCFCGGDAKSIEPDHQPGRVFFKDRRWPEGFVFPACERCNRVSRVSEDLVSLLTSHFDDEGNRERYRKRAASARLNHPALISSLNMTSNERRRAARRIGVLPEAGQTYASMPIARIDPAQWIPHFRIVGKKLALALHYQAFGQPLPQNGAILLSFSTNADLHIDHDLNELLESAPNLVVPMRDRVELGDQFAIRYGSSKELGASIFIINIQNKFVITALSVLDPKVLEPTGREDEVDGPFSWN
jgi:hypothetical protein